MKRWKFSPFLLLLFLILTSTHGEDTVAEDLGVHQLQRLVELLTSAECEDLLVALSRPEENVFRRLERLSEERNQLDVRRRTKRDDGEERCRSALTDWLLTHGPRVYYDRLSRALQHIGRTDVALEVGKNINQDKALNLRRYVEGYHTYVSSLKIPPIGPDPNQQNQQNQGAGQRPPKRKVRDLPWRDLGLVLERAPVPPYQRGPLDLVLPLLHGVLLGFGGSLLAAASVLLLVLHVQRRNGGTLGGGSHHEARVRDLTAENGVAGSSEAGKYGAIGFI